ncbi:unnamed protein product [Clonostachys byssicola]|uniref:HypA protein n=1 Tax=Clonostachys byssicola TaxID=160290 RepID=A0A9N9UV02_9HYPO|nr:unnamed protein product [Clonostachys byssicola]
MATAHHVHVRPAESGILAIKQDEETAAKVSDLLQKDLENHHVYFNAEGFHNHIPHHLLTLYGTGANSDHLQVAYDTNATYQIRARPPKTQVVEELEANYANAAPKIFSRGTQYSSFLEFFEREIEKKGWQDVMSEYVFADSNVSRQLFSRLYSGFLHPMIQLMFGLEWEQPAIIAEALAQAAVHNDRLGEAMNKAEAAANQRNQPLRVPFASLFENIRSAESRKLVHSAHWDDPNRVYDGVLARAPQEAIDLMARIKVREEELEERAVEMLHTAAYVAAAAAWHPPHIPKFDFFLIHHLNSAPIFLTFNKQKWIPMQTKVRLLEWKMRLDLVQYIARGCPPLHADILRTYMPARDQKPVSHSRELLPRFHVIRDDGHTIKVVRAMLIGQEVSKPYVGKDWIRIHTDDDWLRMHYLLLDGVEGQSSQWVRSAGFEQAWEDVPQRT